MPWWKRKKINYIDKDKEKNEENEENKEIIRELFNKLLDENNLFKKEDFFSDKENLRILLLIKINEKGILQKYDTEEYYKI